jgi:hypothetical protein
MPPCVMLTEVIIVLVQSTRQTPLVCSSEDFPTDMLLGEELDHHERLSAASISNLAFHEVTVGCANAQSGPERCC